MVDVIKKLNPSLRSLTKPLVESRQTCVFFLAVVVDLVLLLVVVKKITSVLRSIDKASGRVPSNCVFFLAVVVDLVLLLVEKFTFGLKLLTKPQGESRQTACSFWLLWVDLVCCCYVYEG